MNIQVRVITRARKKEIEREGAVLKVKLTSPPRDGKANDELSELLAEFFHVRRSDVKIMRGEKDRRKVISIPVSDDEFERKFREK